MLGYWFFGLLAPFFDGIASMVSVHGTDFQFSQNPNLLAVVSYMLQSNHFLPMDTYFVIAGLYFAIYAIFGSVKVVEVILNLVRGAGLRL